MRRKSIQGWRLLLHDVVEGAEEADEAEALRLFFLLKIPLPHLPRLFPLLLNPDFCHRQKSKNLAR